MTKTQRSIITVLSLLAFTLVLAVIYTIYQTYTFYADRPMGAPVPAYTPLGLPATWTPAPQENFGAVTLAPTISFPTATPQQVCGGSGVMNVLVIGADSRLDNYEYGLGDAIRLLRVDFSNRKVAVLEFPRDLWVEIPFIEDNLNGQTHEKLNQAYLYGQPGDGFKYWDDPSAGPGLLALTLNLNFGVQVDHYLAVNMRTFEKMVDALGGIDVTIKDEQMKQKTGLPIGKHHLDGPNALKLARNRKDGVFSRAYNQNLVLCAVRKKVISPGVVSKVPDLIESFRDNVVTDFTPNQISQLACLGTRIPAGNITFASFPSELFKSGRIFDPVFDKEVFYWDVDFNILRDYVARFQAGVWPEPKPSLPASEEDPFANEETEVICE